MGIMLTMLISLLAGPTALPPAPIELEVVGVFRPMDLQGRTVTGEREVFLEPLEEDADVSGLVGALFEVSRMSKGPLGPSGTLALPELEEGADTEHSSDTSVWRQADSAAETELSTMTRGTPIALTPSEGLGSLDGGRPAAFAAPRAVRPSERPIVLGAVETPGPERQVTQALDGPANSVKVGAVRIVELRGRMLVAKVIEDGLASDKGREGPLRVSIMTGDRATGRPVPKVVEKKAPSSDALLRKGLNAERRRLELELKRRKRKPKPFRRKVMKWDL